MPNQDSFFPNSNSSSSVQHINPPQVDPPITITYVCVPTPPVIKLMSNPCVDSTLSNRELQPDMAPDTEILSKSKSFFNLFY